MTSRWNHNIHYHPLILDALPRPCPRVLDVGCGEGMLARQLRATASEVTAIDLDPTSIQLAREHRRDDAPTAGAPIDYVLGDFLSHPFAADSFDAIVSVATLHHMDTTTALARMRDLLKPGGTLAVVGLARTRIPLDLPIELAAVIAHRFHLLTKSLWEHPSPTLWPPPHTYPEIRRIAAEVLPGVHYRRHPLWRYSLIWTKPPRR
jgi:2-polyprenyl-3-methyl-5-hydroxy-6-metoxy-1,4-benzoquinol methylase